MRANAILLSAILLLVGCASLAPPSPPTPNVYVMRHLNTPEGATDPDLTTTGQASAEALAIWLSRDPPKAVFVSNTKRSMQTAAPAAKRFGVTPTVYDPSRTSELVAAVLAQKGTVLVVGHSNTVPDIIDGIGGQRPEPLSHTDFGDLWRVYDVPRRTIKLVLPPR